MEIPRAGQDIKYSRYSPEHLKRFQRYVGEFLRKSPPIPPRAQLTLGQTREIADQLGTVVSQAPIIVGVTTQTDIEHSDLGDAADSLRPEEDVVITL